MGAAKLWIAQSSTQSRMDLKNSFTLNSARIVRWDEMDSFCHTCVLLTSYRILKTSEQAHVLVIGARSPTARVAAFIRNRAELIRLAGAHRPPFSANDFGGNGKAAFGKPFGDVVLIYQELTRQNKVTTCAKQALDVGAQRPHFTADHIANYYIKNALALQTFQTTQKPTNVLCAIIGGEIFV